MKIFNTLTRKKEEFIPITENKALIYSCGPTVYNYFHIGNARPFIIFDTLRRFLEYIGYDVTFVQNFTDIDDKMIKKANEEGITVAELAERFIEEYYKDARGLGIKDSSISPRATHNIDEIITTIDTLVKNGYAYESDGDVYFSTEKFKEYGKLSHQPLEDLMAGIRIDLTEKKKGNLDFALWKKAKEGEPFWESPWGKGRPGWHIECSAMANKYLGKTIDIHCGGTDLVFPHHENEIAQSECCNGCDFAHYWMHNAHINVDNRKMSKSLNNFFTVRDAAKEYGYETVRFFMLSSHYRSPINYSAEILNQAKSGLARLYNCLDNLNFLCETLENGEVDNDKINKLLAHKENFINAMSDDLNTADAVAAIFELVRDINVFTSETVSKETVCKMKELLLELTGVLGLLGGKQDDIDEDIEALIEERTQARKEKNFKRADEIRDMLTERGIVLEDTPQGVKWKKI